MAWGLYNKIKKGFKKTGAALKKFAGFINDKIVKPFKPIIKTVANRFLPGAGAVVDVASDGIDAFANGDWNSLKDVGKKAVTSWAANKFGNG